MKHLSKYASALMIALILCNSLPFYAQTRQTGNQAKSRGNQTNSIIAKLKEIDKLVVEGLTGQALEEMAALLEKYPENGDIYYKSYEILLSLNDLPKAQTDLSNSIAYTSNEVLKNQRQQKLDELKEKIRAIKAKADEDAKKTQEASEKAAAENAAAEEKNSRLTFIRNRVNDGNHQIALEELNKLLAQYPQDADLLYKAHEIALQTNQFDLAERWLNSSIAQTQDSSVQSQRKQQGLEIKFKRDQFLEQERKRELAVRFKKLSLLADDGKVKEVNDSLETILKTYPNDPDVFYMAHDVFMSLNDFVAAEFYLNKSIELTKDSKVKNDRQLNFIELNHRREKAITTLIGKLDGYIDDMNYPEAAKLIKQMDSILLYHQKGYISRAGILGLYRQYEEAAKTYNRVLEDNTLPASLRTEIGALRDYCVKKVTGSIASVQGKRFCHFCHGELSDKEAYCHHCLAFQPQINYLQWKNTKVQFTWAQGRLQKVDYHYQNNHTASNTFSILGGILGAAAVGAGATSTGPVGMNLKEANVVSRTFDFAYEDGVPQGVKFGSYADGGEVTSMILQGATSNEPTWEVTETGGGKAGFKLEDILVYPSNPKIDAIFGQMAFKQNLTRGFAGNWNFDPSYWAEPHIFVLYYDEKGRVTRAVESLTYSSESNKAGHLVSNGRKPFTGQNHQDPLNDKSYVKFEYNNEGLISAIVGINEGKETYRREMIYGPEGLIQEKEISNAGKKPLVMATWKYNRKAGKLIDAQIDNKIFKDQKIIFQ